MAQAGEVATGMEIVGADGIHVGMVGAVADGGIAVASRDSSEDGGRAVNMRDQARHRLDLALVDRVEGEKVVLSIDAARAAVIDAIGD